ncbi:MAG: protein phosphatase CheZ [Deltaproteobacteria bacterium]|nr:protein phosphatase CheZ [Deltaproteobacteria bacterium]
MTITGAGDMVDDEFSKIQNQDREKIINTVKGSTGTIQRIANHITGILEALSFQDLSGQRIMKIVRLISDVQVQLLSLLVSFGTKIKQKQKEAKAITSPKDTEVMAQAEVDRMLERVASPSDLLLGPEADGRLNQNAADGLLAELGF